VKSKKAKVKSKKASIGVLAVIPARYGSTRFPGKALADINGKPMIQHVWERSLKSKLIDRLIVATDDKRIFDAVESFGGEAVMTSKKHKSGTDRIGEIVRWRNSESATDGAKYEIIVNIQGDEPLIDHRNIDKAIKPLLTDKKLNVSTLCVRIRNQDEIDNPNVVKVVFDKNGYALYFSRYPIPYNRDRDQRIEYYKHIGLYVYRKNYLLRFIKLKQSRLEKSEKLEQLRILENGEKIRVVVTDVDSINIDTIEDLERIKNYKLI
jgi:3-deoxy-manno-octulosonate cytidylyltransferase (CMP-KDO synthetase)